MTKRKSSKQSKAGSLFEPFSPGSFKWPDDRTSLSGSITSRAVLTFTPAKFDANPTTSHNAGLILYPALDVPMLQLMDDINGTLQDVTTAGTNYNNAIFPPNRSTIRASPGLIRCTGLGLRVTYEGTELQRAGRYFAGTMRSSQTPAGVGGTGTRLSGLSALQSNNLFFNTPGGLEQEMLNVTSGRVSDGAFEAVWRPSKVPQYMSLQSTDPWPGNVTVAAGAFPGTGAATLFNSPAGGIGMEVDQTALVFCIEGDTTAANSTTGNPYKLEVVWHWEYIPQNPIKTIVDLTPSPYDPLRLAAVLNRMYLAPTGRGQSFMSMDTAQPYQSYPGGEPGPSLQSMASKALVKAANSPQVRRFANGVVARAQREAQALISRRAPQARGPLRITQG